MSEEDNVQESNQPKEWLSHPQKLALLIISLIVTGFLVFGAFYFFAGLSLIIALCCLAVPAIILLDLAVQQVFWIFSIDLLQIFAESKRQNLEEKGAANEKSDHADKVFCLLVKPLSFLDHWILRVKSCSAILSRIVFVTVFFIFSGPVLLERDVEKDIGGVLGFVVLGLIFVPYYVLLLPLSIMVGTCIYLLIAIIAVIPSLLPCFNKGACLDSGLSRDERSFSSRSQKFYYRLDNAIVFFVTPVILIVALPFILIYRLLRSVVIIITALFCLPITALFGPPKIGNISVITCGTDKAYYKIENKKMLQKWNLEEGGDTYFYKLLRKIYYLPKCFGFCKNQFLGEAELQEVEKKKRTALIKGFAKVEVNSVAGENFDRTATVSAIDRMRGDDILGIILQYHSKAGS